MGIKGLYTIIENASGSYRIEDLVSIAKLKNGIEILVDFDTFQKHLAEMISSKMSNDYKNKFLFFPACEYDILKDSFIEFHNHFKEVGITLVWVINGPKEVDKVASQQSEETWIRRDDRNINYRKEALDGCTTKSPPYVLHYIVPLLSFEIAIDGLRAAGAEIIQLLQGRSEGYIALKFHERKAFAVISNNADFLMFPGLKVIFPRLIFMSYRKKNLPFIDENPGKFFKKPDDFLCPIITQDDLLKLLELSTHDQLVTLSIIKGNNNTEEYAQDLQYILKITQSLDERARVAQVARFIVRHGVTQKNIRSLPRIDKFLKTHPRFDDAITFCYDLYTLKHFEDNYDKGLVVFDPTFPCDPLTRFIREKLSKSQISKIYSIHCGYFRNTVFTERPTEEYPSNHAIMKEIRSRIYPYLLDSNLHEVVEYDPRSDPHEVTIPVEHATFKTDEIEAKPEHGSEPSDAVIYGIDIFEEIWSHLEQEPLKYVETFGLERGFICYLLRYFYVINKGKNLNISTEELKALFITVFYKYALSEEIPLRTKLNGESFLRMRICPTEKCFIVYSWFMNIYFTGKYLCGGAFNLTEDFPPVENVMSGSVLYAFYENIGENNRASHLDISLIESIEELGKEVLERFSAEYDSITK